MGAEWCYLREQETKQLHDSYSSFSSSYFMDKSSSPSLPLRSRRRLLWVQGPVIVGAGPSGLATAACLKERRVPSLILERANCIASLWQLKTYDRLSLHLPKKFCELPLMPFPSHFPTYPTKQQFIQYLQDYAQHFGLEPAFNERVECADYDPSVGLWRVCTSSWTEYVCRWLVVATGENAEAVLPQIRGMDEFQGPIIHTSCYRSGAGLDGQRVLVVGCGNSGMEVCLDLCNHNASPTLVVRNPVHVLPREMLGKSTFGVSMWLLKWFPVRMVDRFLLLVSWLMLGSTARLGLARPRVGPLELKSKAGKTPVLDVGTLAKIRSGQIKVRPGVKRLRAQGAEFEDGKGEEFDAVILATGYKSNVPSWLKETDFFSVEDGLPRTPFPNGWKGKSGLYAVGFTKRGILGASMDAVRIAQDIERDGRTSQGI
ncbi:hypothetical protein AMTRI_Chr05g66290 [Amborella trichopoda]|uniref:Flavin-containing monooxygenase n=1 Tax=Amborella trichopoda TaxID=13333 RepID=W1NXV9_AMBTC|nr:hypothetical protein AMTR_s00218p00027210 [Amborella trichopoda]